jgi:alpha-glucosidase (family GH31 glycosyl hydrolase)
MRTQTATATWMGLLVLLGCSKKPPAPPPATSTTLQGYGYSVKVSASPFSIQVLDPLGKVKLETVAGDGPRITQDAHSYYAQILPGWDGYQSNERPWTVANTGTLQSFDDHSATLRLQQGNTHFTVTVSVDGTRVHYQQTVDDPAPYNKAALAFALGDNAHFFGMGERYATVDHLGQMLYSWAEEGGLGGGEDAGPSPQNPYPNGPSMTYFPVPFFHTTHGVSVLVDTTRRSELHFGTDTDIPNAWRVAVDDTSLALVFYVRDSPLDAIDDYTADTGRPPIPSNWGWGPRRRIDRGAQVDGEDEWQLMRDRLLPITTIDDTMHSLPANSQLGIEDQLKAWTQTLHQHGYKVVDYNNPYVAADATNIADDYQYGADHGYFEKQQDGGPATTFFISGAPLTISAVDLTSPEAVVWFKGLLQRSIDLGYDGWMHDFGEYVARTSSFGDGLLGDEVHNLFPRLSVKAAHDFLEEVRPGDYDFFVRSGYVGSQAYAVEVWGGDPEASFDNTQGLPAMLRGGLNLGMVGVPYWGSDMGGFKCLTDAPHDKEMLVRWYELGAVSPMMHDENACANPLNGSSTKAKLWDDQQTQDIYRAMASLHTRLAPYFRSMALEAHAHGTPIMRHPFLLFPQQSDAWSVEDSFYLGSSLYAAPVARRGVTTRHVWLPPGRYVELNQRAAFQGPGFVDVPAALDTLPLFLVENQLVPLLDPDVQTLAPSPDTTVVTEQTRANVLDVQVLLSAGGSATLTMADGTVLTAVRTSVDQGNPGGLSTASDATIRDCSRCGVVDTSGQVRRVRLNGAEASTSQEQFSDVKVSSARGPSRRVRWEILELP